MKTKPLRTTFILFLFLISLKTQAQSISFNLPDTICLLDSIELEPVGFTPQSYYWNNCSGNLYYDPQGESSNYGGKLNAPAYIDFAEDENGNFYSFVTNKNEGTITRNFYGKNKLSEPVSDTLGSIGGVLPKNLQGIQIEKDGSSWFIFVVGGQSNQSKMVRLNFGNSLSNAPTTTEILASGLNSPTDLVVFEHRGLRAGFILNKGNNTLTRIDFNAFSVMPTNTVNLGNPKGLLVSPTGMYLKYEGASGKWFMFVTNYGNSEIVRIDFDSKIKDDPVDAVSLGGSEVLNNPFDLTFINDCEKIYGFVLNRSNDVVRFELNESYADDFPVFESLGQVGNLSTPHSISNFSRIGDTLHAWVTNMDNNTITRLFFIGCDNAMPPSSTKTTPQTVRYNQPGNYNINLRWDEGLSSEGNYCQNVVVLPNPRMKLGNDTVIKRGTTAILQPDSEYYSYQWSTGSSEHSIEVENTGTYILTVTDEHGCSITDQIDVIVDIGVPNFFSPNSDGYNDTWEIPLLYNQPQAEVWVYDRFGNTVANFKVEEGNWDGTSNGRLLPQGTYWYIIKVQNSSKPYKGSVSIKY